MRTTIRKINNTIRTISDFHKKHATTYIILAIIILAILFAANVLGWIFEKRFGIGTDENASVTDLSICLDKDSMIMPTADGIAKIKYQQTTNLYICGYLESSLSIYLIINVLDENNEVIYQNIGQGPYHPGYFYSELNVDKNLKPGEYQIRVEYRHNRLATVTFQVDK